MKKISSYYPVIGSQNGQALTGFFQQQLAFVTVYSSDWYWHLSMKDQPEVNVAIVDSNHKSVPAAFRQPVTGLLLNFEMDDVTAYYQTCVEKNWQIVLPLKDEPWGQRHFIASTPEPGLLLDIIQVIPPSAEFADNYHE